MKNKLACSCFRCCKSNNGNPRDDMIEPSHNHDLLTCGGCGKEMGYVAYQPDSTCNCLACEKKSIKQHKDAYL